MRKWPSGVILMELIVVMELDAATGGRLGSSPFDLNSDQQFDAQDRVTVTIGGKPTAASPSGIASTAGILPIPTILTSDTGGNKTELLYSSGSAGSVLVTTGNPGDR